jgi:hypothetical protein
MENCCQDYLKIKIIIMIFGLIAVFVTCGFVIGSIKYIIEELRIEKKDSDYKKYINSIKIGDTFELNIVKDLPEDPFDSNSLNHTEYQCVITDIKKNTKGETWVKYKNLSNWEENTEEIYTFAERRNKIC